MSNGIYDEVDCVVVYDVELTDEEYNQIVKEYYELPPITDVINQIKKFHFTQPK